MDMNSLLVIAALFGVSSAVVRNCRDIQVRDGQSTDGEYCISVDGGEASGQMIYCNGMDTFNPTEYLTLPAGPEQNFASTSKSGQPQCMTGTVKFEKIGLDLDAMVVKSWDDTFTIKDGVDVTNEECDCQPFFGRAFGCPSPAGEVSVNLEGTGFYIPSTVQWYAYGYDASMSLQQNTNQRIDGTCTGWCGGCEPRESESVSLYKNVGITDKVMPIAFDNALNSNPCTL